jgi:hypothetical protein
MAFGLMRDDIALLNGTDSLLRSRRQCRASLGSEQEGLKGGDSFETKVKALQTIKGR